MVSNLPVARVLSAAAVVILVLWNVSAGLAQFTPTVPIFESGRAKITLTNDTFTGRTTVIALTSPRYAYELALIQDGFGRDTKFQYCWAEVRDTTTGLNLTWRAPCNPLKVDECSLVLTSDGDFRLEVASGSATAAAFLSGTGGKGVVDVQLTDQGDLMLVKADSTPVWHSSDNIQRQQTCKEAFHPPNGSHRTRLAWFGVACSIALTVTAQIFSE